MTDNRMLLGDVNDAGWELREAVRLMLNTSPGNPLFIVELKKVDAALDKYRDVALTLRTALLMKEKGESK